MRGCFPYFIIALLLSLLACSGEKPPGTGREGVPEARPPGEPRATGPSVSAPAGTGVYSIELSPPEATRRSTLSFVRKGFFPGGEKVEWLVNGSPVSTQIPDQLRAAGLKRGDKVQVTAVLKSGETVTSNTVQIRNSPPEMNPAKDLPRAIKPGEPLSIEATASDPDGDDVSITYEWTINGQPAGSTNKLEEKLKRGDKIAVKITPFDGETYGRPVTLQREVANMAPVIIEDKKFNFDGKVWTYQVKATDPDNDALAYSLKSGPAGMTIDPSTGFIRWNVPPDFTGKEAGSVSVSDGHGGEAVYNFNVSIKAQTSKK